MPTYKPVLCTHQGAEVAVPIPLELHTAAMHQALAPLAPIDAAHKGGRIQSSCVFQCECVGGGRGGHHEPQPGQTNGPEPCPSGNAPLSLAQTLSRLRLSSFLPLHTLTPTGGPPRSSRSALTFHPSRRRPRSPASCYPQTHPRTCTFVNVAD